MHFSLTVHAQANARKQEHSLPKNASSELNITSNGREGALAYGAR